MAVMIGIDPHKSTHTAVAVDRDERTLARLTVPATKGQTQRLLAWAEPLDTERVWAIESAAGLGRLLAQELVAAGERVIDVLDQYGLPTLANFDKPKAFEVLKMDKKREQKDMNYVLLEKIGKGVVRSIPMTELEEIINEI